MVPVDAPIAGSGAGLFDCLYLYGLSRVRRAGSENAARTVRVAKRARLLVSRDTINGRGDVGYGRGVVSIRLRHGPNGIFAHASLAL